MGIDIGTTGCKATVFSQDGKLLASEYREYDVIRKLPGQAELDSLEVWNKVCQVIAACAAGSGDDLVSSLSASSMGEAMVPLDRQGRIHGNSVLGADTRGLKYLDKLTATVPAADVYAITGQPVGAGYALPNLCWIMEEEPEAYRKTARFIPWADFVTYQLTGEMQANHSLAARTLLFDQQTSHWSKRLIDAIGFDPDKLPPPVPSGMIAGRISAAMSRELGLPSTVKVVSGSHDQCAAAIGSGLCLSGTAMLGLGTYACMVMAHSQPETDLRFRRQGLNIEAHAIPGQNVSFIYHGSGGALLKWLRNEMFRDLLGDDVYRRMDVEMADADAPAVVLPYFAETGPPDYASGGQGSIAGLTLSSSRADILKGAMESIIFYFRDALNQLEHGGRSISKLHVSGGGAESAIWRQMIADILDIPVIKPHVKECGTLGAAIIAGVGSGLYPSFDAAISRMVGTEADCQPQFKNKKLYTASFENYMRLKTAITQCKIK